MKKLFTISWPVIVRANHEYLLHQHRVVSINSDFLQNCVVNPEYDYFSEPEISIRLNAFIFFTQFATYPKVNPLLLTYSAEITHTYRQTLTTSFNFSQPTVVLASVLWAIVPKSMTNFSACSKSYSYTINRG